MADIPILLLAAGGSSRMGTPKPLLKWGDRTLIEHQILTCLRTGQPVVVVLGSGADKIQPLMDHYPVETTLNSRWKEGMGSSISYGVKELINIFPGAAGVLITLVDQPLISHHHLINMISSFIPGTDQILVSRDESELQGVPALFSVTYFDLLQRVEGDEGAKSIIRQHPDAISIVPFDGLLNDIDTQEDYLRLLSRLFN